MAFLVRKITISKWPDGENENFNDIEHLSADAISDIKTEQNTLSWWLLKEESEFPLIAAMICSTFKSKSKKIYFVLVELSELDEQNLKYNSTPNNGNTAIVQEKNRHHDICELTYGSLGKIASIIAGKTTNGNVKVVEWETVIETLKLNIAKCDLNKLGEAVKESLGINKK